MFPLFRSRSLIWIALAAWLAQLCLPTAHAAVMARHDASVSGWCGGFTPAMAAKVAALPDEIRNIIAPDADGHAAMQAECLLLCAASLGAALPAGGDGLMPVPIFAVQDAITRSKATPLAPPTPLPPPRGPPPSS